MAWYPGNGISVSMGDSEGLESSKTDIEQVTPCERFTPANGIWVHETFLGKRLLDPSSESQRVSPPLLHASPS